MFELRHKLLTTLAISALSTALGAPCAAAEAAPASRQLTSFDIPAGPLDTALKRFIAQSRVQIIFRAEAVRDQKAPALQGRFTPEEGLARLIDGTGLEVRAARAGVLVLQQRGSSPTSDPRPAASNGGPTVPVEAADTLSPRAAAPTGAAAATLKELVVTGTHIRGAGRTASPVVELDREALERSGRGTLAEALSDLPQVFNGVATPGSSLTGADRTGANAIVAQGVNLRGLGPAATLVLVNGRRMAGAGLTGDFADVSAIPAAAVERVEVLLDGASAIYGSDAVGGVVNIVLRNDFSGAESRLRLGGASGGAGEQQFAHALGRTWDQGSALLAYEYHHSDGLAGAKRDFAASADLRPLGGSDHRQFYSAPGNIMAADPLTGAYSPAWAIPSLAPGQPLTPGAFVLGGVNLGDQRAGADLLPEQERHAVYGAVRQMLSPTLEASAEVRYSRRDFAYATPAPVSLLTVTSANPFFVSPNGSSRHQIAYAFGEELGPTRSAGRSESLGLTAGFEADISRTWRVEAYAAYAAELSRRGEARRLNSRFLQEALGAIPDDPATAYQAVRDGYFNPFGDGAANSEAVLAFIGSGFSRSRYESEVATVNLQADGDLIQLPGGAMKAAIGVQQRHERFVVRSTSAVSGVRAGGRTEGPYDRRVDAIFLELRAPLVGPTNARPFLERLELIAAGRIERHSDVGESRTPKLGLVWSPHQDLTVRASYGASFRAPALSQVYEPQDAGPGILPQGSQQQLVLLRVGGNLALKPETARTWAAGLDYSPSRMSGLRLSLNAFEIDFREQIARPVSDDIYNALTDPAYEPFVRRIDPARSGDIAAVAAVLATATASTANLFPPEAYSAIVDARQVNTGGLLIRGIDGAVQWGRDLAEDRLDLRLSGTWFSTYERRVTPASETVDLAGRAGQPPKWRGQASATWTRDPWALTTTLNHVDAAQDASGRKIDSWTTADLQLRWEATGQAGWADGISASLSVRNLFDSAPPFYDNPQGVGYDPANGDPLGRFVALALTKRW